MAREQWPLRHVKLCPAHLMRPSEPNEAKPPSPRARAKAQPYRAVRSGARLPEIHLRHARRRTWLFTGSQRPGANAAGAPAARVRRPPSVWATLTCRAGVVEPQI